MADNTSVMEMTECCPHCMVIEANGCTVVDCEVRGTQRTAIKTSGMNNTVSTCVIHNTGDTAVVMDGGDIPTLTHGNNLFYNNLCYDFGIALATCHTILRATGLTAGPESPPVLMLSRGRRLSTSMAIPIRVLMSDTLSAPSASTARAISAISVTLGESLTMRVL